MTGKIQLREIKLKIGIKIDKKSKNHQMYFKFYLKDFKIIKNNENLTNNPPKDLNLTRKSTKLVKNLQKLFKMLKFSSNSIEQLENHT